MTKGLFAVVLYCSLCGVVSVTEASLRSAPLLRGTLWWIVYDNYKDWDHARFDEAIQRQADVGFDVLWILNTPDLLGRAMNESDAPEHRDLLEMVYSIADEKGMHILADLPTGGWYSKNTAEEMSAALRQHIEKLHARYGKHPSFYGWYLNHEINPIAPENETESAYWRQVWKTSVEAIREIAPGTVVTISPFFLLDIERRRGFIYQTPEEYAAWWGRTLEETGIDILMLQDSGEHLSFFTLEDRAPFFAAAAEACRKAGAQFWLNVETGEAYVPDWDTFLDLSAENKVPWRFTPMPWLEEKMRLAAQHADALINWGYFPYMDPCPPPGKEQPGQQEAYNAYREYYRHIAATGVSLPSLPKPNAISPLP